MTQNATQWAYAFCSLFSSEADIKMGTKLKLGILYGLLFLSGASFASVYDISGKVESISTANSISAIQTSSGQNVVWLPGFSLAQLGEMQFSESDSNSQQSSVSCARDPRGRLILLIRQKDGSGVNENMFQMLSAAFITQKRVLVRVDDSETQGGVCYLQEVQYSS